MTSVLAHLPLICTIAASNCLFSVPAKVLFITPSDNYVMNTRVELNCSVDGDPPPYVAWINVTDGSVLQNKTVSTIYIIPNVPSHHKGTYRCETGNRCGPMASNETTITDVLSKYDGNLITLHMLILYVGIHLHQFLLNSRRFIRNRIRHTITVNS